MKLLNGRIVVHELRKRWRLHLTRRLLVSRQFLFPITVVIDRRGVTREVIEGILLPDKFDEKIKPLLSDPSVTKKTKQSRP